VQKLSDSLEETFGCTNVHSPEPRNFPGIECEAQKISQNATVGINN
jgi:hypothetical protein